MVDGIRAGRIASPYSTSHLTLRSIADGVSESVVKSFSVYYFHVVIPYRQIIPYILHQDLDRLMPIL